MRARPHYAILILGAATLVPACAAQDDDVAAGGDVSVDEIRATRVTTITGADDGKTIAVPEAQEVLIDLDASPATGLEWRLVSIPERLGAPYRTLAVPGRVSTAGTTRFYWRTSGPPSKIGRHAIELAGHRRPAPPNSVAVKLLRFTIDVTDASTATPMVEIGGAANATTVAVKEGQDLLLKLAGPMPGPFTGWRIVSTTPSLGEPEEDWVQGSGRAARSGFSTFLWHTAGRSAPLVGSHRVALEIDRGHGEVTTFAFTAKVTR